MDDIFLQDKFILIFAINKLFKRFINNLKKNNRKSCYFTSNSILLSLSKFVVNEYNLLFIVVFIFDRSLFRLFGSSEISVIFELVVM